MIAVVRVRTARNRRPLVFEVGRPTCCLVGSFSCNRLRTRAARVIPRAADDDLGWVEGRGLHLWRWRLGGARWVWRYRWSRSFPTMDDRLLLLPLKFELGAVAALARSFLQHARLESFCRRVLPRSVRKTAYHCSRRRGRVDTLQMLHTDVND